MYKGKFIITKVFYLKTLKQMAEQKKKPLIEVLEETIFRAQQKGKGDSDDESSVQLEESKNTKYNISLRENLLSGTSKTLSVLSG